MTHPLAGTPAATVAAPPEEAEANNCPLASPRSALNRDVVFEGERRTVSPLSAQQGTWQQLC